MNITRGRSLGTRLLRLQGHVQALPRPSLEPDEDDWLAIFEELGRDGIFKTEPDFPVALTMFRDALTRAHASIDPPFDPPPDFQPESHLPDLRLQSWRTGGRFPDLDAAFIWLGELLDRVLAGTPPVTETEFRELAEWFAANEGRMRGSDPDGALDLDGGRRIWCANVRCGLTRGPRADGAGQLAEDIRQLKKRYGQ